MTPKSLFVALELPVNSFQMKTPKGQQSSVLLVQVHKKWLLPLSCGNVA